MIYTLESYKDELSPEAEYLRIYDHTVPEKKLVDGTGYYVQTPSGFEFTLKLDDFLLGLYDASYEVLEDLTQYIVEAYDGSDVRVFTGIVLFSKIAKNERAGSITLQVEDFLVLISRIKDTEIDFEYLTGKVCTNTSSVEIEGDESDNDIVELWAVSIVNKVINNTYFGRKVISVVCADSKTTVEFEGGSLGAKGDIILIQRESALITGITPRRLPIYHLYDIEEMFRTVIKLASLAYFSSSNVLDRDLNYKYEPQQWTDMEFYNELAVVCSYTGFVDSSGYDYGIVESAHGIYFLEYDWKADVNTDSPTTGGILREVVINKYNFKITEFNLGSKDAIITQLEYYGTTMEQLAASKGLITLEGDYYHATGSGERNRKICFTGVCFLTRIFYNNDFQKLGDILKLVLYCNNLTMIADENKTIQVVNKGAAGEAPLIKIKSCDYIPIGKNKIKIENQDESVWTPFSNSNDERVKIKVEENYYAYLSQIDKELNGYISNAIGSHYNLSLGDIILHHKTGYKISWLKKINDRLYEIKGWNVAKPPFVLTETYPPTGVTTPYLTEMPTCYFSNAIDETTIKAENIQLLFSEDGESFITYPGITFKTGYHDKGFYIKLDTPTHVLESARSYRLIIMPGLKDVFGQSVFNEQTIVITFRIL